MAKKKQEQEQDSSMWLREDLLKQSESLVGVDKVLVNNLIEKLCSVNEFTDELSDMVRRDGVMVEKEVGTVNNRHNEMVENPAFTAYNKAVKVLADISMKVSRVAKGASSGDEDDDGFDSF